MFDLKMFAKGIGETQTKIGEVLGVDQSQVSFMMNGRRRVLAEHIEKLRDKYGDIVDRYITDRDLVSAATMQPYPTPRTATMAPYLRPQEVMRTQNNVVTDAESVDLSGLPAEVVEELKAEVKSEEAVPIISPQVAACDNCDIGEYLEEDNELEHFIPSDMTANVDGAEIVRKTSMLPTFAPNDVVFIKLIKDKTRITDGGTYYFKLRKRATMIRMVKINGKELRLIAQNPQFGDVITSFDEVINVASIEGLYRKNIANQYNEIETLRRKKDAQTDELIKQNGDALRIVDRLVTVIEKKM